MVGMRRLTDQENLYTYSEMAVFQDTGLFPHEYTQIERNLAVDYYNRFFKMGAKRAHAFVFDRASKEMVG